MSTKKVLMYPGKMVLLYLIFTLVFFFFGPITWKVVSPIKLIVMNLIYIFSFYLGYKLQIVKSYTKFPAVSLEESFPYALKTNVSSVRLLLVISCCFTLFRDLVMFLHNYKGLNLFTLFEQAFTQNIGDAYFNRIHSSVVGTWYVLVLNLVYVICLFWFPLGVAYFKKLSFFNKMLLFITFAVDFSYSIFGGAVISIALYIIQLVTVYFIVKCKSKIEFSASMKNKISRKRNILILAAVLFFMFFGYVQEARYQSMGYENITYSSGYIGNYIEAEQDWPVFGTLIKSMQLYMTHGYVGMSYALELPPEWTFGIGYSRGLSAFLNQIVGINVKDVIYPARLEEYCGWKNGQFWPTAYTWFASDWTFWGIPIVMFLFGVLFAGVWKAVLYEKSIIPYVLFGWLWIGIFFIPCNNQLFQSFEMFMGTVSLMILFIFRKSLPRIV